MTKPFQADRLSIKAFAQEGEAISGSMPLQDMERLSQEAQELKPESAVEWTAMAELRARPGADADIWLNLEAGTSVQLICQRCMNPMQVPLKVSQWYRFVESEDIAMDAFLVQESHHSDQLIRNGLLHVCQPCCARNIPIESQGEKLASDLVEVFAWQAIV